MAHLWYHRKFPLTLCIMLCTLIVFEKHWQVGFLWIVAKVWTWSRILVIIILKPFLLWCVYAFLRLVVRHLLPSFILILVSARSLHPCSLRVADITCTVLWFSSSTRTITKFLQREPFVFRIVTHLVHIASRAEMLLALVVFVAVCKTFLLRPKFLLAITMLQIGIFNLLEVGVHV